MLQDELLLPCLRFCVSVVREMTLGALGLPEVFQQLGGAGMSGYHIYQLIHHFAARASTSRHLYLDFIVRNLMFWFTDAERKLEVKLI